MRPEKELENFSKVIEEGNLDELSLTIYYIDPTILTRHPLSVDDLKNYSSVNKIIIEGKDLEEHISLFRNVTNTALKSVRKKSYINARIYYIFETEESGKILDVVMWGDSNSMLSTGLKSRKTMFSTILLNRFCPKI